MDTKADKPPSAIAAIDQDRMTVSRFREAFPRARWSDESKAWVVPGKTAEARVARWRALEQSKADVHADAKGRDAFAFEGIESPYLEAGFELIVRTPYSRTVVEELRAVPYARWDGDDKVWRVPFRSYDELKKRWSLIEEAALRNEPSARRRRMEERKGTEEVLQARQRMTERRRRRFPLPVDDPPPLERPVSTASYGIVAFEDTMGELADDDTLSRFYPHVRRDCDMIWARWRTPSLEELVKTWPARLGPSAFEIERGWWMPTKPELVEARKAARSRERRRNHR